MACSCCFAAGGWLVTLDETECCQQWPERLAPPQWVQMGTLLVMKRHGGHTAHSSCVPGNSWLATPHT